MIMNRHGSKIPMFWSWLDEISFKKEKKHTPMFFPVPFFAIFFSHIKMLSTTKYQGQASKSASMAERFAFCFLTSPCRSPFPVKSLALLYTLNKTPYDRLINRLMTQTSGQPQSKIHHHFNRIQLELIQIIPLGCPR